MKRSKHIIVKCAFIVAASTALAVVTLPFSDWNTLTNRTPDILVVRCSKTPDPLNTRHNGILEEIKDGLIASDIQPVAVLKGAQDSRASLLSSQYWPRQGEHYLVFAILHDGAYHATEPYRVVPLGINFPTNILAGKSLNEQIRALLQYRLDMLNREMAQAQEEKKRLEEGLKQ